MRVVDASPPLLDGLSDLIDQYRRLGDEQRLIDVIEAAQTLIQTVVAAVEYFPFDEIDLSGNSFGPSINLIYDGIARLGLLATGACDSAATTLHTSD